MVLLPLSHFSQRSNKTPPNREAFVLRRHSTSGMGMTTEDCAGEGFLPEQRAAQERGEEDMVQV